MPTLSRTIFALIASLVAAAPAAAADLVPTSELQAQFNWRVAFGGPSQHLETRYGLGLGYRASTDAPQASLFQLDIGNTGASALLAGLPVMARSYRADDTASVEAAVATGTEQTPWYAHQWIWWTTGGVALTAALAGSGSHHYCADTCYTNSNGTSNSSVSVGNPDPNQTCVTKGVDPAPDTCVGDPAVPLVGSADDPRFYVSASEGWLDAGNGGMGDLVAQ